MSTTPARRFTLPSLALTPLLAGALLVGAGGVPSASTVAAPGHGFTAAASSATAAGGVTSPVGTASIAYVTTRSISAATGLRAVRIAAAQRGKPYRWGGSGPWSFDCSGLVYYVYKKRMHIPLPRTANAQRRATIHIAKSHIRPGDLVFFMRNGRAYHVGIYAGRGKIWHAPRPGQRVMLQRIWTSHWVAGRVR